MECRGAAVATDAVELVSKVVRVVQATDDTMTEYAQKIHQERAKEFDSAK